MTFFFLKKRREKLKAVKQETDSAINKMSVKSLLYFAQEVSMVAQGRDWQCYKWNVCQISIIFCTRGEPGWSKEGEPAWSRGDKPSWSREYGPVIISNEWRFEIIICSLLTVSGSSEYDIAHILKSDVSGQKLQIWTGYCKAQHNAFHSIGLFTVKISRRRKQQKLYAQEYSVQRVQRITER